MKLVLSLLFTLFLYQENNPPQVRIITPLDNSSYSWGSSQRYAISVSDKEDGDTKYDEIPQARILLEVRAMNDTTQLKAYRKNREALHAMMSSNCMNCHTFNSKLIGPSFADISRKKGDVQQLIKHVKEGSTGIWGDIVMPSHPELSNDEVSRMVEWIMTFATESNVQFFTGNEGTFSIPKPQAATAKAMVVLSASYLDNNNNHGEHVITLKPKG
jgi:cytochrome c